MRHCPSVLKAVRWTQPTEHHREARRPCPTHSVQAARVWELRKCAPPPLRELIGVMTHMLATTTSEVGLWGLTATRPLATYGRIKVRRGRTRSSGRRQATLELRVKLDRVLDARLLRRIEVCILRQLLFEPRRHAE